MKRKPPQSEKVSTIQYGYSNGGTRAQMFSRTLPARGRVDRVTDCGVRGLWFKSPGSILTSRIETSSLSRVVRDGWDPCSLPLSVEKKYPAVESSTWPLNSLFRKLSKNKNEQNIGHSEI